MISQDRVLADIRRLPTLPVSLARITALANDDRSDIREFEAALRPDPALTASMLRMANSARYGCSRKITSVRQAVMLLGTSTVVQTAVGGALSRVVPRVLPGYGISAASFFRHCVAVAVIGERIGADLGLADREQLFTIGLLHDIGKLVVSDYLSRQTNAVVARLQQTQCAFIEAERELLGVDHAQVGAAISEKWQLPDTLCRAVRWHHEPENVHEACIDVLHVADALAHAMGYGTDVGELARRIDSDALSRIGPHAGRLERVVCESADDIESLSAAFLDNPGDA